MNIKELKDLIKELPDEMSVRILVSSGSSTLTYPGKGSVYTKGSGISSLVFERDKSKVNKITEVRITKKEAAMPSVPQLKPKESVSPLSFRIPGK